MLLFAAAALIGLVGWFVGLEARGERHTVFLVFCAVFAIEAYFAGGGTSTPLGILRLEVGGFDMRPQAAIILAAFASRLAAKSTVPRVSALMAAWGLFLFWYTVAVFTGFSNGIARGDIFFQGKAVLYIGGGLLIGNSIDVGKLAASPARRKFAVGGAALVIAALLVTVLDLRWAISTPLQDVRRLGSLANDTVTLLTVVGVGLVMWELTRRRPDRVVLAAAIVMSLAPLTARQRASFAALGVVVLVGLLVSFGKAWKRRTRTTSTEGLLVAGALLAVFLAGVVFTSSGGLIAQRADAAFGGENEVKTAQVRIVLAELAIDKISASPVIGDGVGTTVEVEGAGVTASSITASSHNVVLDLAMRTGIIGAVFFVVGVWLALVVASRAWRTAEPNRVAGLALAVAIVLGGVLSKMMLEPGFDFHRLAIAIGLCVGMLDAISRYEPLEDDDEDETEHEGELESDLSTEAEALLATGRRPSL